MRTRKNRWDRMYDRGFGQAAATALVVAVLAAVGCGDEGGPGSIVDPLPRGFSGVTIEPSLPGSPPEEGLISPIRVTTTPAGRLLVADGSLRRIVALDPESLQPQSSLAVRGKPAAVHLLGEWILVANRAEKRIDVYASEGGAYLRSFGRGQIEDPSDLAVDQVKGLAFVADARLGQILVYDWEGTYLYSIGGKGGAPGRLETPVGIAADPATEQLYVADWGDWGATGGGTASVEVFGFDGSHEETLSGAGPCGGGDCLGGFSRPHGITVTDGKLFVPDLILAQVLVFDRNTLSPTGVVGGRPSFRLPSHALVLNESDLYVVSNGTGSVEVLRGGAR